MYIYKITNTKTGKVYIGSAKDYEVRWDQHKNMLEKGTHHSPKLQNSYLFHGAEYFKYEVLEDLSNAVTREDLYKIEGEYIKEYDCINNGYNCKGISEDNKYAVKKIIKDIDKNRYLVGSYIKELKDFLSEGYGEDLKRPVLLNGFNVVSGTTPLKRILHSIDVLFGVISNLESRIDYEGYLKVSHVNYLSGTYDYQISDNVKTLVNGEPSGWKWVSIESKMHYKDQLLSVWVEELVSCDNGKALFSLMKEQGLNLTMWLPENLHLLKESYLQQYLSETKQEFIEIEGFDKIGDKLLNSFLVNICEVSGKMRYDRKRGFTRSFKPYKEILKDNNVFLRSGKYYMLKEKEI